MFIQTEATPNPATLKFLPGRIVLDNGTLDLRSRDEAALSPLAERLFAVDGVSGVFFGSDFIAVTKDDAAEWQHLKPMILGGIMEHFMSGAPLLDGGDITFKGFKDGVVYLHMKGACSGCPSSTATLRHGIQNLLRHFLPDVTEVRPM
jgi:Fe-S cluster biogenesis protein NfuA